MEVEQIAAMYADSPPQERTGEKSEGEKGEKKDIKPLVDLKGIFSRRQMEENGFSYWSL